MRAVVQRVSEASVSIDGEVVAEIGPGMLVLLAAAHGDGPEQVRWMAEKLIGLRIFSDDAGKMNLSLEQVGGEMLVVSQFTLYGDCRKGKRPSYTGSAPPDEAVTVYRSFIDAVTRLNVPVREGVFGAMMQVHLVNDGPVTADRGFTLAELSAKKIGEGLLKESPRSHCLNAHSYSRRLRGYPSFDVGPRIGVRGDGGIPASADNDSGNRCTYRGFLLHRVLAV